MIKLLVVDDDAKLNRTVFTYLNDSGFQAKGCLSAKDAYDEMYNNLYELIISDIMMPAVDVYITKLRDKLSVCDGFEIKTVQELGYKAVLR